MVILCSFSELPAAHFKNEGVGLGRICTVQEGNIIRVGLNFPGIFDPTLTSVLSSRTEYIMCLAVKIDKGFLINITEC